MKALLKTWMLAIAIVGGIVLYVGWMATPFGPAHIDSALGIIKTAQPILLFTMLFVSFSRIEPRHLTPRRWHLPLLALQVGLCLVCAALPFVLPNHVPPLVAQAAMLCFICPTATAAIVVTGKLGGDIEGLTAYTTLANLAAALVIPTLAPIMAPHPLHDFATSFLLILGRIFPMLILPFFVALLVRRLAPAFHQWVARRTEFSFYLWAVSLTLAIIVSSHAIATTTARPLMLGLIALISLASCVLQFALGRRIGRHYQQPIAAAQALGQKNTIFIIWAAYTFFDPASSIAGGFYSIWHNLWNSYQLSKLQKT
ncbi:MAG: transporter [Bacteroidaceae bacterium]|nr:transporter [Bacteroidaceae bacterium]